MLYASTLAESARVVPLGCGVPLAITAAGDQLAVATADDSIRIFDVAGGRRKLVRTLENLSTVRMEFAANGRYLVLQGVRGWTQRPIIRVVDAVSGAQLRAWSGINPFGRVDGFAAARHAERLARVSCNYHCWVEVTTLDGTEIFETPLIVAGARTPPFSLSPNGRRLTFASDGLAHASTNFEVPANGEVLIYEDGVQVATVKAAYSADWLDDDHLLIGRIEEGGKIVAHVTDARGVTIRALRGEGKLSRMVSDSSEYYVKGSGVYSLADGALVWEPARATAVAWSAFKESVVVGKQVGFFSGHQVTVADLP
jgi:hypothetical protein